MRIFHLLAPDCNSADGNRKQYLGSKGNEVSREEALAEPYSLDDYNDEAQRRATRWSVKHDAHVRSLTVEII